MASVRRDPRRSDRWQVRFRNAAGKGRTRSFPTKAAAEAFRRKVEVGLAGHDGAEVTVREFVEARIEFRYSDPVQLATREQVEGRMRKHVFPHLGDVKIGKLDDDTIESWALGLKRKGLAVSTVRLIASNLRSLLADAVGPGRPLVHNPVDLRSVKHKIEDDFADTPEWESEEAEVAFWDEDQVVVVIAALRADLRIMAEVCVGLGVRQGELFGLAVEDIDFLAKKVTVRSQVKVLNGNKLVFADLKHRSNRKKATKRSREVPLPDDLATKLTKHIASGKPKKVTLPWAHPDGKPVTRELLFVTRESNAWNRNYFNVWWHAALKKAGLPVIRRNGTHALRHHFASMMIDAGVPITALAEYLGHASGEFTLRIYGHKLKKADDVALEAMNAAAESRAKARRSTTVVQQGVNNVVDLHKHR